MKPALLILPLLLAACDAGPNPPLFLGADPLRPVARAAPFAYGRTADLAGRPAGAAEAAAQIEAFAQAAETDPLWTHPRNAALLPQLQIARREFREALGVPPGTPPAVAVAAFRQASLSLRGLDPRGAEAALAPLGGTTTLARLSAVPRLPRVEEAAQALAIEASGSGRGRH